MRNVYSLSFNFGPDPHNKFEGRFPDRFSCILDRDSYRLGGYDVGYFLFTRVGIFTLPGADVDQIRS